ncbi:MAG: hypothetical protein GXO73_06390 [Calditrichaeota bacterium]|nr:hypothetical protein [Calditrichota bacterium]
MSVAWARDAGTYLLSSALEGKITHVDLLVGINHRGTTAEALVRAVGCGYSVRLLFKHPSQTFHPKVYRFEGGAAGSERMTLIVGSSNLTHGGLLSNYEANLMLEYDTGSDDFPTVVDLNEQWEGMWNGPYTHALPDADAVRWFLDHGYLTTESAIRQQRRLQRTTGRRGPLDTARVRTSPPPRIVVPGYERLDLPFPVPADEISNEGDVGAEDADPAGGQPRGDRFFVRTLTRNDVRKLRGEQTGTFEPDLGETARNRFPGFWGWPDAYEVVTRQSPRYEWGASGRLFSSIQPDGIDVDVVLWYREERPGHAAEHRLRLGPISVVRAATPSGFTQDSLLIVERAPENSAYDFYIRLTTDDDPEFVDYANYLTEIRPAHRYGYGPQSG